MLAAESDLLLFYTPSRSSQTQALPHIRLDNALILLPLLPPHTRRIHIRRALIIRLRQHTHHTNEDLLDALDRAPPLARLLILQRILAWRMQYRDADLAVGVYVRVPHVGDELHLGRRERVVFGKLEFRGKNAAFEGRVDGALDQGFPEEHVVFVDGAGGYAFWGIGGEGLVLFEEALRGGVRHCGCVERVRGVWMWWWWWWVESSGVNGYRCW